MSGPFGSQHWMYASGGFYDHTINQSLRVNGSNKSLSRTVGSSVTNRKKFTISGWVKLAFPTGLTSTASAHMWAGYGKSGGTYGQLGFYADDLYYYDYNMACYLRSTALFRDRSAWYHIVLIVDTTQSTPADRNKVYVNGTQITTWNTQTNYSLNHDTNYNVADSATNHFVGASGNTGGNPYQWFEGYIAEFHFVDGTAVAISNWGETKDGVWIAKKYSGSHGDNGYYLPFDDTSAIGDDESANTNDFTSNNLVATDILPDSPTNNWCTNNAAMRGNFTHSEGNLKLVGVGTNFDNMAGTFLFDVEDADGWYWEGYVNSGSTEVRFGISKPQNIYFNQSDPTYNYSHSSDGYSYKGAGQKSNGASANVTYGDSFTTGDVIGIAVKAGALYFYKNGTIQNSGTAAYTGLTGQYVPAFSLNGTTSVTANYGQDSTFAGTVSAGGNSDANGLGDFKYSVPSGHKALCSSNLPDSTIGPGQNEQADDNFNTVLYTGNASTNAITGVGFQPDWTWLKSRSNAQGHNVFDSVRGANKALFPNDSNAEFTDTDRLTSFDSDGFSLGADANVNTNSATYVSWNWKAGGSASSNSNGSITSSVSANQDAGFSIVSWTGTGSAGTIGHGLSSAPEHIIVKNRDSTAGRIWLNYVKAAVSDAETDYLSLNGTGAAVDNADVWNDTAPTSTVFSVGSNASANEGSDKMIAYCFHSVEGYSKFGSYTGNGNADGTFVYTGFRPAWLLIKNITDVTHWAIWDTKRNTYNVSTTALYPSSSDADQTGAALYVDFLSSGFKWRASHNSVNGSNDEFIYLAFAEAPFKYANAR